MGYETYCELNINVSDSFVGYCIMITIYAFYFALASFERWVAKFTLN